MKVKLRALLFEKKMRDSAREARAAMVFGVSVSLSCLVVTAECVGAAVDTARG